MRVLMGKHERMAVRLGRVACQAREGAGLRMLDIAEAAGVSEPTISRFEKGAVWGRRTDTIVFVYERLCGLERGELWRRAVNDQRAP